MGIQKASFKTAERTLCDLSSWKFRRNKNAWTNEWIKQTKRKCRSIPRMAAKEKDRKNTQKARRKKNWLGKRKWKIYEKWTNIASLQRMAFAQAAWEGKERSGEPPETDEIGYKEIKGVEGKSPTA